MPRWTPESRQKHAELAKARRLWEHGTGPKTEGGKGRSSKNAYKHGLESAPAIEFRRLMRAQDELLKLLLAAINLPPPAGGSEGGAPPKDF